MEEAFIALRKRGSEVCKQSQPLSLRRGLSPQTRTEKGLIVVQRVDTMIREAGLTNLTKSFTDVQSE